MRLSGRFCFINTIKQIKDLSLELDELATLVVLSIDIVGLEGRRNFDEY
jgi:hypothetical protein